MDGPDNRYGQLYKPISATAFNEASNHGLVPIGPYRTRDVRTSANLIIPENGFRWPTLSDLNDELDDELWESDPDARRWRAAEMLHEVVPTFPMATAPGPPPAAPNNSIPVIPSTNLLNER